MTRELFATARTIHQAHDSEIDLVSETEAVAIWSMEDGHVHAPQDGNPSTTLHGDGFYRETWKLVGGPWRLARLELRRNILDFAQCADRRRPLRISATATDSELPAIDAAALAATSKFGPSSLPFCRFPSGRRRGAARRSTTPPRPRRRATPSRCVDEDGRAGESGETCGGCRCAAS